ncbi:MAG: HAD family hydrolase, partial [Spirochaetota bacterium]
YAKELLPEVNDQYDLRWHAKTVPYAGITKTVTALKAAGLKLAILSNKPHRFAVQIVEHYFPESPFDCVCGYRHGIPRKPDPAAALDIVRQLDIPMQQWIYIGDSNTDMKTAVSAGIFAVGAAWGFRPVEELVEAGANMIIRHPEDILQIISPKDENCQKKNTL